MITLLTPATEEVLLVIVTVLLSESIVKAVFAKFSLVIVTRLLLPVTELVIDDAVHEVH